MSNPFARAWRWCRQWFTTSQYRPELGRNDPCWCGSGKKYKHCHMAEDMRRGTLPPNVTPKAQRELMERAQRRMEQARARKARKKRS